FRSEAPYAAVAHLVERHLAKVEVASSSLVGRSRIRKRRCRRASASSGVFCLSGGGRPAPGAIQQKRRNQRDLRQVYQPLLPPPCAHASAWHCGADPGGL